MLFDPKLDEFTYPLTGQVSWPMFLPIFCFLLLILIFFDPKNSESGLRKSFFCASTIWGVFVLVLTEVLSLFKLVTFFHVTFFWFLAFLLLGFLFIKKKKTALRCPALDVSLFDKIILINIFIFLGVIGLTAFFRPANPNDSMTYHMPRVAHWMQNQSIQFFPTNNYRQLWSNPFSEFAILQFQVLGQGSDRFATFIQFFSFIGSMIGVTYIAKELGAKFHGQILAAILAITIPMAIVQASGTKNGIVVAYWLTCFVCFLLSSRRTKRYPLFFFGSSLGLGILTKATFYVYAFPFGIWMALSLLKHCSFKKAITKILLVLAVALVINMGHYYRSYEMFGSPVSSGDQNLSTEIFSPRTLITNMTKGLVLHAALPSKEYNLKVQEIVEKFFTLLKWDINDPQITYALGGPFRLSWCWNEACITSPVHFYLLLIVLLLFCLAWKRYAKGDLVKYFFVVSCSAALYFLLCKFYMWYPRFHHQLGIVLVPAIAIVINKSLPRYLFRILALLILNVAWPVVLTNTAGPIFHKENIFNTPRIYKYYYNSTGHLPSHIKTVKTIRDSKCYDVGLLLGWDSWEYPYWMLLKAYSKKYKIEHIEVPNKIRKALSTDENASWTPCAIIQDKSRENPITRNVYKKDFQFDGFMFLEVGRYPYSSIFLREDLSDKLKNRAFLAYIEKIILKLLSMDKSLKELVSNKQLNKKHLLGMAIKRREILSKFNYLEKEYMWVLDQKDKEAFLNILKPGIYLYVHGLSNLNNKQIEQGKRLLMVWSKQSIKEY